MVKSYAWSQRLTDIVEDAGTVDVLTPGFISPENFLTDETGTVLDGHVLTPQQATVAWDADFSKATVTNASGNDWIAGATLYLTVAGKTFDPADIQASFDALELRVSNLETRTTTLEGQMTGANAAISGLSDQVNALDARVAALEAAIPPAMRSEQMHPAAAPMMASASMASMPAPVSAEHAEEAEEPENENEEHPKHAKHKDKDKDHHKKK